MRALISIVAFCCCGAMAVAADVQAGNANGQERISVQAPGADVNVGENPPSAPQRATVDVQTPAVRIPVPVASLTTGPDGWRYKYHNNQWWYWLPSNSWVIWNGTQWNPYDATVYRGRYATGYRGLNSGTTTGFYDGYYYGRPYYRYGVAPRWRRWYR